MTERFKQAYQIGSFTNPEGNVILREMVVFPNDQPHIISVATSEYVASVKDENPEEKFYVFPETPLPEAEEIWTRISEIPTEELSPYLTPQIDFSK